jgi:hypothetical protein
MSDDLDDLLRRAMKTLDDQVPSGYFEDLPNRTLSRLEAVMDTSTSGGDRDSSITGLGTGSASGSGAAAVPSNRDDSGLHDIRGLASSQRMRLASRRSSQNPIIPDDDVLASSSAGWKAVALPEPAKMVSLPDLHERESKQEIKARQKAEKQALRDSQKLRDSQSKIEDVGTASTVAAPVATAVTSLVPSAQETQRSSSPALQQSFPAVTAIGSRVAPKKSSKRNVILGVVGGCLAAAAGVAIFVSTRNKSADSANSSAPSVNAAEQDRARSDEAAPLSKAYATPPASAPTAKQETDQKAALDVAGAGSASAVSTAATGSAGQNGTDNGAETAPGGGSPPATSKDLKDPAKDVSKTALPKGKNLTQPVKKPGGKDEQVKQPDKTKPEDPKGKTGTGKQTKADGSEPNFDDLLKEAGVKEKKTDAPKLDKKSLSAGDFKTGMAAVAGRAQACYNGTQGTATVRLTVAPNGTVSKATVSGAFAGTPVAACVEGAVRAAKFPAWEGGPQSFGYSYLLSE